MISPTGRGNWLQLTPMNGRRVRCPAAGVRRVVEEGVTELDVPRLVEAQLGDEDLLAPPAEYWGFQRTGSGSRRAARS